MKRKFRSLELMAKTMINSFGSGNHASNFKDSMIDVDVVREYQAGDKKLDSRSSLRTSQTMSRVFTPDKSMSLVLALDVSASLYSKLEQAIVSCLYLSYLVDQAADHISLLTFSDKVHNFTTPDSDCRNVNFLLEKIYEDESVFGITDLEEALLKLGNSQMNNTLFVLVSDFCYSISDRAVGLVKRILSGSGNKMIVLALVNHKEWGLGGQPFAVDFVDAESKESAWWNFGSYKSNKKHEDVFRKWLTDLKIRLRQARAEPIIIPVDRSDYLMPLVKFLLMR